jgi:multidrug transporter EmrE-like cation transporter
MKTILLLVIAGVLVSVGDFAFVKWMVGKNANFLLVGILLNIIGILFYAQTLSSEELGISTAAFLGVNIFLTSLGGKFLFKQDLGSGQIIGLIILLFGLILIEL